MERDSKTRMIARIGLMAALVIAGSAIRIPTSIGTFNLGNTVCALAGVLFGPVGGGLAAGIGSMLYDIIFYPAYITECWITLLTKGAIGLTVGLAAWSGGKRGFAPGRNIVASAVGATAYLALYIFKSFAWNGLFLGGMTVEAAIVMAVGKAPMSVLNGILAVVFAPILATAIQKALKSEFHRPAVSG